MLFLAFRYMIARKRQTLLTMSGVLLGTTAFVTFYSIMTGFQGFIIDQLVNNDSHVRVSLREEYLTEHQLDENYFPDHVHVFWKSPPSGRKDSARILNPAGWFTRLDHDPSVLAYVPQYKAQALANRGKASQTMQLIGTEVDRQVRVSNIEHYMTEGKFNDIGAGGNRIVVGDGLLKHLGARVGESVLISSGHGLVPFKVVGTFHFGVVTMDDTLGYSALPDVQRLAGAPSVITDIAIRLTDVSVAAQVANDWQSLSVDKVQSWDQANASILSVFSLQDFIRNFVTISIMVVASFGIYNILNILVNQKRKDIGILRSMGFTGSDVVRLFLVQGITLGFAGGILGLVGGFTLCTYISTLKITGMMDRLQISFSPRVYALALCLALISSIISSVLPARAAGQFRPIDILRSGE